MERAPGRNNCQDANCRGRLTTAKPERRPDEERNAEALEWIILKRKAKTASGYNPARQKSSPEQQSKLKHLLRRPIHPGILSPQHHKGSPTDRATRSPTPPDGQ